MKRKFEPGRLLRFGLRPILLAILFLYFTVSADSFFSPMNLGSMLLQQTPVVILLAAAMSVSMILGGADLSIGANISLSSYVCAMIVLQRGEPVPGILAGIGIGLAIGFANGLLTAKAGLPPFIATYCMAWVAEGTVLLLSRGRQLSGFLVLQRAFGLWEGSYLILALVVLGFLLFLFERTVFGKTACSTGRNPKAAAASGIRVDRQRILVFVIGGAVSALAGLMYMANFGAAEPTLGADLTTQAFAAALAGGAAMAGGRKKLLQALIGGMILVILRSGLLSIGVSGNWLVFVYGIMIFASVFLDYGLQKGKERSSSDEKSADL